MHNQPHDPLNGSAPAAPLRRPRDTAGRRRFVRNILAGVPTVVAMSAGTAYGGTGSAYSSAPTGNTNGNG